MVITKKKCQEKKVIMLVFILGLIMSFLIPVWQTPDEYSHLNMIGNSLKIDNFADNMMESIGIENGRIEFNYEEKVNISDEKEAMFKAPTYEKEEMLPHGIELSVIKHLPATIGIMVGIIIGIPTIWVMHLGELFSLFFYSVICYYALKLMPIKKELFAFVMLFPMALQQAGSINYDAVLLPFCFLFIAYVFYLKYEKNEIALKEFIFLIFIWGIITYIKLPYIFLAFLILIIPLEKINISMKYFIINEKLIKKTRLYFLISAIFLLIASIYLLRNNQWIQIIYGFVVEWKRGIYLLLETGKTWGEFLMISTVGNFGWLDTPMNFVIVSFVFFIALLLSSLQTKEVGRLKKWDYIVLIVTIICLCIFTTIALTNHTIKTILFGSEFVDEIYDIRTALYQIPYF